MQNSPHSHAASVAMHAGIEPMWTRDVLVSGCRIKNGDDCITIKSGSSDIHVEDLWQRRVTVAYALSCAHNKPAGLLLHTH